MCLFPIDNDRKSDSFVGRSRCTSEVIGSDTAKKSPFQGEGCPSFSRKYTILTNFASKDFVQRIFSMIVNLLTNGDHKIVWFSPFS